MIDSASVKAIMNRRNLTKTSKVGENEVFTIQGDGNVIDVRNAAGELVTSTIPGYEGTVLQKKIFNTKSNSQLAMSNERTRNYLIDGLKAEKAGDKEKAHELFNKYLNACQVSFGVLLPSPVADTLVSGSRIAADIALVTTENGSLLTIDTSTIMVKQAGIQDKTTFNLEDFEEIVAKPAKTAKVK
jgi:hypothetical protein